MPEVPMKMYWMGEDIETLPREKLIEIIRISQHQLESARETTRSIIEINELGRRARALR